MLAIIYPVGIIAAALLAARYQKDPQTGRIRTNDCPDHESGPWSAIFWSAVLWPLLAAGIVGYWIMKGLAAAIRFVVETPRNKPTNM